METSYGKKRIRNSVSAAKFYIGRYLLPFSFVISVLCPCYVYFRSVKMSKAYFKKCTVKSWIRSYLLVCALDNFLLLKLGKTRLCPIFCVLTTWVCTDPDHLRVNLEPFDWKLKHELPVKYKKVFFQNLNFFQQFSTFGFKNTAYCWEHN